MSLQIISEGTKSHPRLAFEENKNTITIQGWSFCENPVKYYEPLTHLVDELMTKDSSPITINIDLLCFNTASSKFLVDLARKVKLNVDGASLPNRICWFYNEEDMETMEWGQDIALASGVEVELIPSNTVTASNGI